MQKRKPKEIKKDQLKAEMRERYKDSSSEPIFPKSLLDDNSAKRVAIYMRTAVDDPQQFSSCELLKDNYKAIISQHPNWNLVGSYIDKGVSGSSTKNRDAFNRMIADCESGKIDLIITKNISRFSRNLADAISYVKKLRNLDPPVGVFFESEYIYTLNQEHVNISAFIEAISREESKKRSEAMKRSYELRRKRGLL